MMHGQKNIKLWTFTV